MDAESFSPGVSPLDCPPFVRRNRVQELLPSDSLAVDFLAFLQNEYDDSISWYARLGEDYRVQRIR